MRSIPGHDFLNMLLRISIGRRDMAKSALYCLQIYGFRITCASSEAYACEEGSPSILSDMSIKSSGILHILQR